MLVASEIPGLIVIVIMSPNDMNLLTYNLYSYSPDNHASLIRYLKHSKIARVKTCFISLVMKFI